MFAYIYMTTVHVRIYVFYTSCSSSVKIKTLGTKYEKDMHIHSSFSQLEQEIDLILEMIGVFVKAVDDWTTKWAPAILEYGYTLTGKKAAMVLTAQKIYESMCMYTHACTCLLHMHAHECSCIK